MFTMLLFLRIKQKLTRIKLRPVGNEESSVVNRLIEFGRGEISTNNVTIPAISSLHDHWDSILANTVPVPGCRCAFCDIRPAAEKQRRKRKPRTQASAPVRGLPPQHSVIDMLYTFPCSESQRQNAILAASKSSARIPMKGQRLQSNGPIVNMPGFEPDTSLNIPPGMQSPRLHSDPDIEDPSAVSSSPSYDINCTDNRSIPQNNYDVLGPYPNPSNYIYLSTLSD